MFSLLFPPLLGCCYAIQITPFVGALKAKQHGRDRKKEKAAVPITEAKRPNDQLALLDSAANAGLSMLAVDNNKCSYRNKIKLTFRRIKKQNKSLLVWYIYDDADEGFTGPNLIFL